MNNDDLWRAAVKTFDRRGARMECSDEKSGERCCKNVLFYEYEVVTTTCIRGGSDIEIGCHPAGDTIK